MDRRRAVVIKVDPAVARVLLTNQDFERIAERKLLDVLINWTDSFLVTDDFLHVHAGAQVEFQ